MQPNPLSHINHKLILASKSPRRQELLKGLGLEFEIRTKEVEEVYPNHLKDKEVAIFLSELKAEAFKIDLQDDELVITSDTIVCLDDKVLGKPKDKNEAVEMLSNLSGKKHTVYSAVTLTTNRKQNSLVVGTDVFFKKLSTQEIDFYINTFQPFDKAGSYGIQEWIGYIGIEKIEGNYFNVMGLPLKELYQALMEL